LTASQLGDYLRAEAEEYIVALEQATVASPVELDVVRRSARRLSGVARLAGQPGFLRAATAIDQAVRSTDPVLNSSLADVLRESLPHCRALVAAGASDADVSLHVTAVIERCNTEPATASDTVVGKPDEAAFLEFVCQEAFGVADALDRGIDRFVEEPEDRDVLGTILQRQRSLLGSARLGELPVLAETLRAVEDVAELVVRLDVPIKSEWLDVFRAARDVLRAAGTSLADGEAPVATHSLSRLRTLHVELVDRYGQREAAEEAVPAAAVLAADTATHERAGRLRMELMNAIGANARARAALEELYALALRSGTES